VDVGPRGTTLPQMREAALSLGYETEIYKATPEDLENLQLPVILHLDQDAADPLGMGHFVLLADYKTDIKQATLFDGVTGSPAAFSFEALRRMWTGYLLCPKQRSDKLP